ncbi:MULTISPECIES: hypothetical protein [unclassified Streptomyces]|jgi:hypothetical protein|uniref:hypothetical protein n=1 Tax=unclassified Streptomyces TaxID=2593676 RepID=UPI00331BC46C
MPSYVASHDLELGLTAGAFTRTAVPVAPRAHGDRGLAPAALPARTRRRVLAIDLTAP